MKKNAQMEGVESDRGGGVRVPILNGVEREVALRTNHLSRDPKSCRRKPSHAKPRESVPGGGKGTASPRKGDDIGLWSRRSFHLSGQAESPHRQRS